MIKAVLKAKHRLPVRLVTQSRTEVPKKITIRKKNKKKNLVVNRGRVRRVTFGTGANVVESAGVLRVKVSYNDPRGN